MIVWSGRGFLSLVVLLVILFISVSILPKENASIGFVIAFFVTGIFSWYFGEKWNLKNERIVVDENTGQRMKIKNVHTLFWIPMQYWGVIFSVLGISFLLKSSVLLGIIFSIILLGFIVYNLLKNRISEFKIGNIKSKISLPKNKKKEEIEREKKEREKQLMELERERIRKEKEDPRRFMPK